MCFVHLNPCGNDVDCVLALWKCGRFESNRNNEIDQTKIRRRTILRCSTIRIIKQLPSLFWIERSPNTGNNDSCSTRTHRSWKWVFFLISPIPCCEQIRSIHNILFGKIGSQLKLQNKFSVGLQTIPIFGRKSTNHINRFQRKMLQIKKFSDQLRNSPDYYVIAHFFYKKILLIQHNLWQKCFFLLDVTGQLLVNDICYVFAARSYVGRVNGKCAQYDCR